MSATDQGVVFGSTSTGFVPRQLKDIMRAINEDLAIIVDPRTGDKPFQNASDDTILQQIVAIFAEEVSFTENAAHEAFYMRDPLTATGAGESHLVQLNGIIRHPGSRTIIPVTLTGSPGALIPADSRIGHADGLTEYAINVDAVIPLSGECVVSATCTKDGPYDPEADTVVTILTPASGWNSATNGITSSVGKLEETDEELRRRQQLATNATSYRQIEAIRAAVANVAGVTFVRAYQNRTLIADERGIPGKTLACVVVGGDDQLVANAIIMRTPLGIGYSGSTCVTFYDDQAISTAVQFSRPTERPIYVRVNISVVIDEGIQIFPSDGIQRIKDAIIDFSRYGHSICEPLGNPGFPPGQDIVRSQLYTPINSIGGSKVHSVSLGFDADDVAEQDLTIAWDEIGMFTAENIQVILQ